MANGEEIAVLLDALHNLLSLRKIRGHRLLQENGVTLRRESKHRLEVHLVLRADQNGVGKALDAGEIFPRIEAIRRRNGMHLRQAFTLELAWFGDRDDFGKIRVFQGVGGISLPSFAGADDSESDRPSPFR